MTDWYKPRMCSSWVVRCYTTGATDVVLIPAGWKDARKKCPYWCQALSKRFSNLDHAATVISQFRNAPPEQISTIMMLAQYFYGMELYRAIQDYRQSLKVSDGEAGTQVGGRQDKASS